MSALDPTTQLPAGFTTLEQLAVYAALVMGAVNPDLEYLLDDTTTEKVADLATVTAADGTIRLIGRISVPLDPEYSTNGLTLWANAQEVSNVTIPARFLA